MRKVEKKKDEKYINLRREEKKKTRIEAAVRKGGKEGKN